MEPTEDSLDERDGCLGLAGPGGKDVKAVLIFLACLPAYFVASLGARAPLGLLGANTASQIVFFVLVPLVLMRYLRFGSLPFGLRPPRKGTRILVLVWVPLAVLFFLQYEGFQERYLFESQKRLEDLYREMFVREGRSDLLILVSLAVVPPFCEEFLFRGVLLSGLASRWKAPVAVLASAFLFALIHPPLAMPPIFLLALLLGGLTAWTRSLWPAVAIHVLNNGLVASVLLWPSFSATWQPALVFRPSVAALSLAGVAALGFVSFFVAKPEKDDDPRKEAAG